MRVLKAHNGVEVPHCRETYAQGNASYPKWEMSGLLGKGLIDRPGWGGTNGCYSRFSYRFTSGFARCVFFQQAREVRSSLALLFGGRQIPLRIQ